MTMPRLSPTGLCALLLGALVPCAQAAEQCTSGLSLDVPASSEGLYSNFVSGVTGQTEASVPGFDLDIYAAVSGTPSGQMKFYWGSASTGGAGVATSGDTYAVLLPGDSIGPDSLFTRAAFTGNTAAWQAGTSGYLGMRFRNESSGAINYGWLQLVTSAPLGFPATIRAWCYEDGGLAISVPLPPDALFADGFQQ